MQYSLAIVNQILQAHLHLLNFHHHKVDLSFVRDDLSCCLFLKKYVFSTTVNGEELLIETNEISY